MTDRTEQPPTAAELQAIRERAAVSSDDWDLTGLQNVCEHDVPRLFAADAQRDRKIELLEKLVQALEIYIDDAPQIEAARAELATLEKAGVRAERPLCDCKSAAELTAEVARLTAALAVERELIQRALGFLDDACCWEDISGLECNTQREILEFTKAIRNKS